MTYIFWLSVIFIFYAYFGYPLALMGLSLFRRRDVAKDMSFCPPVSFIITVHNEELRIREKIKNTLELDYPADKLEIIFASDASTDATDDIVKSYPELKLVRSPGRHGKEYAQKCAVVTASGEILVFSDVATILDQDGLRQIVANFADHTVGCVSSEDRFIDSTGQVSGEGAYVRYEMYLRNLESRVNTLVGLSGSFFAARCQVCESWAPDIQSDFNTLMNAVKLGLRGVSDQQSIGCYKNIADEKQEFDRKVRTVLRGLDVLRRNISMLNVKKYGLFSWQLFSHKLCRWLVPLFLITAFVSNALVMAASFFYFFLFLLQICFYICAYYYQRQTKHVKKRAANLTQNSIGSTNNSKFKIKNSPLWFSKLPYYFVTINISIIVAWWKYLKGDRKIFWEPSQR